MAKNKTLPKDFETLLKEGDLAKLKAVFNKCNIDARGGYLKQTALAFSECPDELAAWLVANGLSISEADSYGSTPLQTRAGSWNGNIRGLISLGADVNEGEGKCTALHVAAGAQLVEHVQILLENGARVNALDKNSMTPLEYCLQRGSNATLERVANVAELLLNAGAEIRASTKKYVLTLGTNFEFHRNNFNPESREAASAALEHLYKLFDVPPVPRRKMHDGVSPIIVSAKQWQDQHQELWEFLVPGSGPAPTVQGEVIRISGRIARELEGNGGGNWDEQFKQMADAWLIHIHTGNRLSAAEYNEAAALIKEIKRRSGNTRRLCELATIWVALNPNPKALPKPEYQR